MAAFGTYYLFYLIYAPYRAEFPNKIFFHHYFKSMLTASRFPLPVSNNTL